MQETAETSNTLIRHGYVRVHREREGTDAARTINPR